MNIFDLTKSIWISSMSWTISYSLRPFQIASLKEYISTNGKLISYYELQVVPGFDVQTIKAYYL